MRWHKCKLFYFVFAILKSFVNYYLSSNALQICASSNWNCCALSHKRKTSSFYDEEKYSLKWTKHNLKNVSINTPNKCRVLLEIWIPGDFYHQKCDRISNFISNDKNISSFFLRIYLIKIPNIVFFFILICHFYEFSKAFQLAIKLILHCANTVWQIIIFYH